MCFDQIHSLTFTYSSVPLASPSKVYNFAYSHKENCVIMYQEEDYIIFGGKWGGLWIGRWEETGGSIWSKPIVYSTPIYVIWMWFLCVHMCAILLTVVL